MGRFSGEFPYNEYWVYAPIYHKKENRNYAVLVSKLDSRVRTTISYAKYILSVKLKRFLEPQETADHKNEDKLDDRPENLQVLSEEDNRRKYINKRVYHTNVDLICPNCNKKFTKDIHATHLSRKGVFTSCSRRCSGILRQRLQMGENINFSKNVVRIYKEKTKI